MKGILADRNLEKQARVLIESIRQGPFAELFREMKLVLTVLADHGLAPETSDRDIWRFCQTNGLVLLTDNRNADDADSLQRVIAEEGTPTSLPVITVSKTDRVLRDAHYRREAADGLFEFLFEMDLYLGAGRLFVPRAKQKS